MDNSRIGAEPFQGFGEPGSTLGEVGAHQPLRPLIERDDESRYRCYGPIPLDYTFHTSPREQNCSILSLLSKIQARHARADVRQNFILVRARPFGKIIGRDILA